MRSGRSIAESFMVLVPEAHPSKEAKAFYQFHAPLQEPWDGPALLTFADGLLVGATLDRNGLRPARYTKTKDGFLVICSGAGAVPIPLEGIARASKTSCKKCGYYIELPESGRTLSSPKLLGKRIQ